MIGCQQPTAQCTNVWATRWMLSRIRHSTKERLVYVRNNNSLCGLDWRLYPWLFVYPRRRRCFLLFNFKYTYLIYTYFWFYSFLFSLFVSIYIVEIVKMCFLLPFIINWKICERACASQFATYRSSLEAMRGVFNFIHTTRCAHYYYYIIYLLMNKKKKEKLPLLVAMKQWQRCLRGNTIWKEVEDRRI